MRLSICICTRNRPDELRRALGSVLASGRPAHQTIVSDDSTDGRTQEMVVAEFPDVTYVAGRRLGLAANRNLALRYTTGSHVMFIDDDVVLAPGFLDGMACRIEANPDLAERLIVTGTEINRGQRVFPHKQSFLGFQALDYGPGDRIYSIVINSTVFPSGLFDRLTFDECLVYGYEEIDFSARAVYRHGYVIVLDGEMANDHFPSPVNRDFYLHFTEASRIYVTFKKYWWLERRRLYAVAFLLVAYPHNFLFNVKRHGTAGIAAFAATVRRSVSYLRRFHAAPTLHG